MDSRPVKRAYERLKSGLEWGRERVRMITLTSSLNSVRPIRESWEVVVRFFKRRGIVLQYYGVVEKTKSGLDHMHVLYRGPFMYQWWLSMLWKRYHGAEVVYIQRTYGTRRGLTGYLLKYLLKGVGELLTPQVIAADSGYIEAPVITDKLRKLWSSSYDWCYRGSRKVWQWGVHLWVFSKWSKYMPVKVLFSLWEMHLRSDQTPAAYIESLHDLLAVPMIYADHVVMLKGNRGFFGSRERLGYAYS